MPIEVLSPPPLVGDGVAKHSGGRKTVGRQINFRAPDDMAQTLERIAPILGQDVSALIRLILSENLHLYEQRANDIVQAREKVQGGRKKKSEE